jgi:sucrose-6-phosphate hydrolase SacC (GH32 family)
MNQPFEYTQDMRANHELCPLCGTWHTAMSCPPQFAMQSYKIVEQQKEIQRLHDILEKINNLTEEAIK